MPAFQEGLNKGEGQDARIVDDIALASSYGTSEVDNSVLFTQCLIKVVGALLLSVFSEWKGLGRKLKDFLVSFDKSC